VAGLIIDDRLRRPAAVALVAYAAVVAWLLLSPTSAAPSAGVGWLADLAIRVGLPDALVSPSRIEFVSNVGVMVPVAVLAGLVWTRLNWRDWTAFGFVLSAGVELVQGVFLPGRSATFADVVANTLGMAVGGLVLDLLRRRTLRGGG
jgi:hypothetical protein